MSSRERRQNPCVDNGQDVVVCGPQHGANMNLARDIEHNANGPYKRCGPHAWAGTKWIAALSAGPETANGAYFLRNGEQTCPLSTKCSSLRRNCTGVTTRRTTR